MGEVAVFTSPHELGFAQEEDRPLAANEVRLATLYSGISAGTELTAVQEGIPDAIPAEMCYLGWQESLTLLARLVEAEIPG